ncbi:hypothetical protein S7711_10089 [Stachybotrys chartarum IBT 7711]|uniref:Zn(2)-C6 fungal-type domain-containing protein n=1 Tax=Stachybotrys chartarum (strain CBS 109288 / IBT 7711) TaxID=1280523 RepID=A0A084B4W3_STACB|nr:hypothetical protein S7711_10089 [Stachybotrys chartarum IBT 7711]
MSAIEETTIAIAATTTIALNEAPVSIWSCLNCKRRKVRCDRKKPYTNCARSATSCVYPTSGRLPRRPKRTSSDVPPQHQQSTSHGELLSRIKRVEELLNLYIAQLEGRLGNGLSSDQAEGCIIVEQSDAASLISRDKVRLLREGFEISENATADSVDTLPPVPTVTVPSAHNTAFLFHRPTPYSEPSLHNLSPLPSQMLFMWEKYLQNVDPFLKILHVPTVEQALRAKNFRMEDMDPATRALMNCISYAAVATLAEEETRLNFDADQRVLMTRFRKGAEYALAAAEFVTTADLTTVQAFTIFLSVLSCEKSTRYVWSLTGLLLRIALSMSLHKDGSSFPGIGPFETEIRRRIWWHICFLDMRADDSQVHDVLITDGMFNTERPNNVNDADIHPDMTEPVRSVDGTTDSSICLVRCKAWYLAARNMRPKE